MSDPILESMFEGEDFDTEEAAPRGTVDPEYGKGRWPNAILREVTSQATSEYGHSIMLKVDLKGDEGMPFTFFADAPLKPVNGSAEDETALKRYNVQLNRLKTLVHATGTWVTFNEKGYKAQTGWPKAFDDFSGEERYGKLVGLFERLVGSKLPVNVKYFKRANGKLSKDVWGLDPRKGA